MSAYRVGEGIVIGRQQTQQAGGVSRQDLKILRDDGGGEAVRLREQQVDADRCRIGRGDAGDELRDARARPRPLPETLQ